MRCEVSGRNVDACLVCYGCSGEELVDSLVVSVARVLEEHYLKQHVGVQKLHKQEDYEKNVRP